MEINGIDPRVFGDRGRRYLEASSHDSQSQGVKVGNHDGESRKVMREVFTRVGRQLPEGGSDGKPGESRAIDTADKVNLSDEAKGLRP